MEILKLYLYDSIMFDELFKLVRLQKIHTTQVFTVFLCSKLSTNNG